MKITVNGVAIDQRAIDHERQFHENVPDPERAARYALAIRELLLQRARTLGIIGADDAEDEARCDAAIDALCAREAPTPEPTEEECRRYYASHRARYCSGDLVEAAHILFAVTATTPIEAVRRQAESTLKEVCRAPERFAGLAAALSNCPSGAQGGSLGQLQRGDSVPEFESAVFGSIETGVLRELVRTRYGFHVVSVGHRIAGRALDFETVRADIARALKERVQEKAMEQYVRILAARAQVEGVDLGAATSPLVR